MKSIVERMIGDLDEKKAYYQTEKRAKALPKKYRVTFKKIRSLVLVYNYGHGKLNIL